MLEYYDSLICYSFTSVSTCRVLGLSCCPQQGELPVKPVLSVRHDPLVATASIARLRAKAEKETRIYKEQSDHARVSTSIDHTPDISDHLFRKQMFLNKKDTTCHK